MAYRTLLAVCTALVWISSLGCAALGLASGPGTIGSLAGDPRSGSPNPVPGVLADAGDSIFRVVAWSFAVIAGALALAFVAKLLNHRPKTAVEIPTTTFRNPSAPAGTPAETDRIVEGRTP